MYELVLIVAFLHKLLLLFLNGAIQFRYLKRVLLAFQFLLPTLLILLAAKQVCRCPTRRACLLWVLPILFEIVKVIIKIWIDEIGSCCVMRVGVCVCVSIWVSIYIVNLCVTFLMATHFLNLIRFLILCFIELPIFLIETWRCLELRLVKNILNFLFSIFSIA